MTRPLQDFPGGILIPNHKELSNQPESLVTPLPERIILPLQQGIGLPAKPIIAVGDKVLKGQMIARAEAYVSVSVHASTSGKVIDIGAYDVPHPLGMQATCIVIEPDGEDRWIHRESPPEYTTVEPQILQEVIRNSGITGLGGAGFPAHVKLMESTENAVEMLIINGVECEPYISCDDRLIREKANYIVAGARILQRAVQARHCVIAVEDDMQEAYAQLEKFVDNDLELVAVPARYPAGGEKQLIKVLTGKEVPSGGLPIHIGIVIYNVGTAASAYRAATRYEPLISRYVTVTGAVDTPRNLQVLLGTPVEHCVNQCGYRKNPEDVIILGGPMMGMHVKNMNMPVIKTTNCVLVTSDPNLEEALPCIRCGHCAEVCPAKLLPQELLRFSQAKALKQLHEYHLFDCIECGCCAYVCPSNIPLVHYYRKAKKAIAMDETKRQGADHARRRFEARNARLQDKNRTNKQKVTASDKQTYIQGAVERVKRKRQAHRPDNSNDQDKPGN